MRISNHPIMGEAKEPDITIIFDGKPVPAVKGEPVAAALLAAGIKTLRFTEKKHLPRGIFCGILMYMAVSIYRDKQTISGILFCVPVFILAGFEHSVANMFYFGAAGMFFSMESIIYLAIVVLGNTIGGMLMPVLAMLKPKEA